VPEGVIDRVREIIEAEGGSVDSDVPECSID
jgi:hypothetical protein